MFHYHQLSSRATSPHVKYLHQSLTLTGFNTPTFQSVSENIAAVHDLFSRFVGKELLQELTATGVFWEYVCTFWCPTDSIRNPVIPQEWHQNSTGIGILEVYYDMQVYISVVWCYLVIRNTITQLHASVCYYSSPSFSSNSSSNPKFSSSSLFPFSSFFRCCFRRTYFV